MYYVLGHYCNLGIFFICILIWKYKIVDQQHFYIYIDQIERKIFCQCVLFVTPNSLFIETSRKIMRTQDVFADQSVVDVLFRFELHQKNIYEVYIRLILQLNWHRTVLGILYTIRVKPVASILSDKSLLFYCKLLESTQNNL